MGIIGLLNGPMILFKRNSMEIKPELETFAKIKVVGVGGGGNSAIGRMAESELRGIEFIAVNSDAQALHMCNVDKKIHIGKELSRGLGAGMNPEVGRQAAEEDEDELRAALEGADMVFITCGLGGGTGTGASPKIAEIARDLGALTLGVVTKPFSFEGSQRREIANKGHIELEEKVDSLITIPNDKLLQIIDKKTSLVDAFAVVDDVLKQGVQGISDLITIPGVVNVDFADVKAIMQGTGSALMGIGRASGENRSVEAAKAAIASPLLELSIGGAKGVLFNISGGEDLGMFEIDEAARVVTESVDPDAKIIFGAVRDPELTNEIKITVIATGFAETTRDSRPQEEKREKVGLFSATRDRSPVSSGSGGFGFQSSHVEKEVPVKESSTEEELDIPAFIRKKMG